MYRSLRLLVALLTIVLLAGVSSAQAAPAKPPRPTPRPTPTPVTDPVPALSACASDIFGLNLTYTQSGGMTANVVRNLTIPTTSKSIVSASITAKVTSVYGRTSNNGLETLVYGSGSGSSADASVAVSQASLCYLQFTSTQAAPTTADEALALLKSAFPGVPQRAPYVNKSSTSGYVFALATSHPVSGTDQTVAQALMLTAVKNSKGQLILGALSGTGTYAAMVPVK